MTRRGGSRVRCPRAIGSTALAAAFLALGLCGGAPATAAASHLALQKLGRFSRPVGVDTAPGARNLLFVVQKHGKIRILRRGEELKRSFLDIAHRVSFDNGERGLLSVAFDPGYARNRRFYVDYTNGRGNVEVDQFKRSRHSRFRAAARSRRSVIVINHQQSGIHNGGQLQFDRHGRLYIAVGDGGTPGDPEGDAQSADSLLGKILRIHPRAHGGYTVPRGNPFVGGPGRDEIFALGLRNPWRFSFDRKTGDLWVGDVGWSSWEEIDRASPEVASGANFGWNLFEGAFPCTPCGNGGGTPPPGYVAPVHTYPHSGPGEHGFVIIGGYVVRDRRLPSLYGRYIYTDYVGGDLRVLDRRTNTSRDLGPSVRQPTSFGEGVNGRIYVVSRKGPLYRLVER